jgi:phosphonate transport system ATP-binding protein
MDQLSRRQTGRQAFVAKYSRARHFASLAIPRGAGTMLTAVAAEVIYSNGTLALTATSLAIEPGKFTVLLGPSGAGKSTLLRSFNGLVQLTGGRIEVAGIGDISDSKRLRMHRRQTGMVFQQHHLIGRLNVLANVLTGRLAYHSQLRTLFGFSRAEKEMALRAIDRVGLLNEALRRADELSGGQQQRVGIARALVQSPKIILADEPVASLDPATSEQVLSMLHGICRSDGLTAVVSLHQLEFARKFADRIVGLHAGKIVFDGPPSQLDENAVSAIYGNIVPAGARPIKRASIQNTPALGVAS